MPSVVESAKVSSPSARMRGITRRSRPVLNDAPSVRGLWSARQDRQIAFDDGVLPDGGRGGPGQTQAQHQNGAARGDAHGAGEPGPRDAVDEQGLMPEPGAQR